MALYVEPDDVRNVLRRALPAQQPDRVEGNASTMSDALITQAIDEASSEIDAKLSMRYVVPFVPVPPIIFALTATIAAYLSDLTFREIKEYNSDLNPVYLRYQRAQGMLTALSEGTMRIPPVGVTPDPSTGAVVVYSSDAGTCPMISEQDFDIQRADAEGTLYWTSNSWAIH